MILQLYESHKNVTNELTKQDESSWKTEEVPGSIIRKGKFC